jgi:hypothetical protein
MGNEGRKGNRMEREGKIVIVEVLRNAAFGRRGEQETIFPITKVPRQWPFKLLTEVMLMIEEICNHVSVAAL